MAEQFKIMRAWDKGLNKIAYVYRNPETGKKGLGETKFDWFFYVLTEDYERLRSKFTQFINNNVINTIVPEGKYSRVYADYPHRTESLTKDLEMDWGYKTFSFNDMLEKLKMLDCETFEADIPPYKRFALQDNVEFEQDYKCLFLDIETDDRIKNGQPIPGEFRILSVAVKDLADGKEAFMRIAEDTDEEERNLLIKLGKVINGYDVIIGWNSCFPKDTRITMNDGSYKNIQDIVVGDRVLSYRYGRSEISEVKHLFKHKNYKAIYKITTDKREIIASDEHPFLATYSNVNRWVRAKNLRAGDYLTKFRRIDLPTESRDYRPEDYLFCGMIMTDGHIPTTRPGCFDFHTTNEQYLRWMKKYLTRNNIRFDEYVKRDDNPNHKKQYQLKCKNFDYWKMLLDLGVPTGRKTEKPIDLSKIYQQSRNRIKMFLLGLWIGDGYKTQRNQQYICNQNTDLDEWVVKLFARVGQNWYISKFSKDGNNYFRGVGKIQQDHIPIHYVKKANIKDGFGLGGALSDIMNEKTPCTSGQFERFFNDNGDVAALSFEQVLSIEIIPFDDYVYNFETENHTYIANDLIVHNCSFDIPYIKSRMMRYGIQIDWRKVFHQDQMKVFQKSVSLRSYSLENVSQEYLGEGKVQHEGIGVYEMWLNHPELLEKYNRVDVRRCFELENKTKYLAVARNVNAIGMCPCDDLFITRKVDNLIVKQAQIDKHYHFKSVIKEFDENGCIIQDHDEEDDDKFEGAYVFPPKPGRYKNTKVLDYSSLYPNVIKTLNISPDTLITDDSMSDEMCIKTPSGHRFRKDFIGILPKVIAGMKDKRDYYKDLMSKESPGSLMHKTYDNLQYVYKSFGLSFYGALGETHTRFYDVRVAESVTLGGQYFNKAGAQYLEEKGYIILYGDSVTKNRCTVIRVDDDIMLLTFEELFGLTSTRYIKDGKEYGFFDKTVETMSYNFNLNESEWKPIETVIRHKTNKEVYHYRYRYGITEITKDHSLINSEGQCFKPTDGFNAFSLSNIPETKPLDVIDLMDYIESYSYTRKRGGDVYLTYDSDKIFLSYNRKNKATMSRFVNVKDVQFYGFLSLIAHYICNGSSTTPETTNLTKKGASIASMDIELLTKLQEPCEWLFKNVTNNILKQPDGNNKLQMGNALQAIVFKQLCGQKYNQKKIPDFIYRLSNNHKKHFIHQLMIGDGSITQIKSGTNYDFESASIKLISGLSLLMKQVGMTVVCQSNFTNNTYTVKNLINEEYGKHLIENICKQIDYDDYVYDLSVADNHNFVDAMGSVLLHNTDSLFVDKIKTDDEVITLLEDIKVLCEKIATEEFNTDICTLEMSYDKGFRTFLIVNAKKRYAGYIDYLDGHEVNPCKLKITGFEYVRTDQCGFVKKYQKEILEWILADEPPTPLDIRGWILDKQTKVFSGKLPLEELMFAQKVTKPIEQYTNPLMHIKVAEQMLKDGKDFWVGDKVPYFIESFDTRKKPLPRPLYAFKGKYNETYYWNNKIFPAFERILSVAFPTIKWDSYYVKGNSTGSAKAGRSFLWS